jgi:hypothetical protein
MAVEDPPLVYADFEGVIPPAARALDDGHLLVELHGQKLRGCYALQRIGPAGDLRWLLIKREIGRPMPGAGRSRVSPSRSQAGRTLAEVAKCEAGYD